MVEPDGFLGVAFGIFDIDLSLEWDAENFGSIRSDPLSLINSAKHAPVAPAVIERLASSDAVKEIYLLRFEHITAEISPMLEENIREFLARQEQEFVRQE